MIEFNSVNVKLSNSQLEKLKPVLKNATGIALRLSSDMIDTSFSDNLLSTNTDRSPVFARLLPIVHQST